MHTRAAGKGGGTSLGAPDPRLRENVTGLVLAGGRGSRMGGRDKGLVEIGGRPMLEHVLERLAPQVAGILINANRNRERYARWGHPVVPDAVGEFAGPLAGMLAGLEAASTPWVLTAPCDAPLLAPDLGARMADAVLEGGAELAVAHDGTRHQPVFLLLPRALAGSIREFLEAGEGRIDRWFARLRVAHADLSDYPQCFLNVNDPGELARVERLLGTGATPRPEAPEGRGAARPDGPPVPVVGFAALSGSGKTTLLREVIRLLAARGVRCAIVKHAHHTFDIDHPGKDSYELRKSGAVQTLVASRNRRALITETPGEPEATLKALLAQLDTSRLDLVLVEGFKHEHYPKIEVFRPSTGNAPLHPGDPCYVAVATDEPDRIRGEVKVLDLNHPEEVVAFIETRFLGGADPTSGDHPSQGAARGTGSDGDGAPEDARGARGGLPLARTGSPRGSG